MKRSDRMASSSLASRHPACSPCRRRPRCRLPSAEAARWRSPPGGCSAPDNPAHAPGCQTEAGSRPPRTCRTAGRAEPGTPRARPDSPAAGARPPPTPPSSRPGICRGTPATAHGSAERTQLRSAEPMTLPEGRAVSAKDVADLQASGRHDHQGSHFEPEATLHAHQGSPLGNSDAQEHNSGPLRCHRLW